MTDDRAFGADDVAGTLYVGEGLRKLRFPMTDNTGRDRYRWHPVFAYPRHQAEWGIDCGVLRCQRPELCRRLRSSIVSCQPLPGRLLSDFEAGTDQRCQCPVLISSAVEPFDLIRLATFKAPLYVSEQFEGVFGEGRFTGYSFQKVPTTAESATVS